MRIVHLLYDDIDNPWLGGGGARRAHEVNRRLSDRHQITVVAGGYPAAPMQRERDGVSYRYTPPADRYAASRLRYLRHAPTIARELRPHLIVEDFSAYNPLFSPLWAGVPVVGLVQNLFGDHSGQKYGLLGRLAGLVERPALRRFRQIIVLSRSFGLQLHHAINLRGRHAAVIASGIADVFFSQPQLVRAEVGDDYLLYFGRIDIYQKGLDTLLAALYLARQQEPSLRLLIVGGGTVEQEGRLRDLIAGYGLGEAAQWRGRLTQAEIAALLHDHACRFTIVPSRYESWGMSAAEAGAAGQPVLAFAIPGLDEAAATHGLLLANSDDEQERVAGLAGGLLQCWGDRGLRARLGLVGREWAGKYTWGRVATAQERFYLEAVGRRG